MGHMSLLQGRGHFLLRLWYCSVTDKDQMNHLSAKDHYNNLCEAVIAMIGGSYKVT
jgi:hypothetical protein